MYVHIVSQGSQHSPMLPRNLKFHNFKLVVWTLWNINSFTLKYYIDSEMVCNVVLFKIGSSTNYHV